jgi:antitoxin HigA-1
MSLKMKSPSHPGQLIKSEIEYLGLSITKAAKGLGITRQQLHRVIKGECALSPEMAVRLEKAIGSTADTWLHMQLNYDLAHIRKQKINVQRFEQSEARTNA